MTVRIGIDVGGTNTDAVLMDGDRVVAAVKSPTTDDVTAGIVTALKQLEYQSPTPLDRARAVMIGTTQFTNAIVEARGLAPTGCVRLGLPATAAVPPMADWPPRLTHALGVQHHLCHGGYEFDGRPISPLDPDEIGRAADEMLDAGVRAVAVTGVFSPVNRDMEEQVADLLSARAPDLRITLSHELGRIGLVERENAALVNASLGELADTVCDAFQLALHQAGITAPVYLSQNDGTLMDVEFVRRYPVATFASGPTNSMRGAAMLSGLSDCAVVDIGGTTSDVGMIVNGFPRPAGTEVHIGGVRTNFRMPDVVAVGIGGGSVVRVVDGAVQVGPDSVGHRLTERSMVFGGDTLTASDIAAAAGLVDFGERDAVADLDRGLVRRAVAHIAGEVAALVDRMRTSSAPVPVVLVGGGSAIVGDGLPGFETVRPEHYAVANAIGAAIAQVGGEVDRVEVLQGRSREQVLQEAKEEAADRAVAAGARADTVRVVEVEEYPMAYLPGNAVRVKVKAVGDLLLPGEGA
ncbi:hydantoinase/oxoprolinase N-terminal domain-containing protein [Streptomyces somaliensis]|uniref:hydantoinase/oxoprolinase N-terminal domain-containing protein n=2 Tax=Streptomyces somaliensis TaxID=78355 RepID=UPI0034E96080|nr:hydantoinase/oxoprolinase family protein [Streptomyces somaliensis]